MTAFLLVYGAVMAVLLVAAVPQELRQHRPPQPVPERPLGWCLAAARERRDRIDPGARWEPLPRTSLPSWLTEPARTFTVPAARIPPADRLDLTARCRWPVPSCSTTTQMETLR